MTKVYSARFLQFTDSVNTPANSQRGQGRLTPALSPLSEDRSRVGMHANKRRSCHAAVDQGRKRVRLIAAGILAARKFWLSSMAARRSRRQLRRLRRRCGGIALG